MAFTVTENRRIEAIETMLNTVQTALNNVASKQQMKAILNIRQSEIEELQEEIVLLKQRVLDLENA